MKQIGGGPLRTSFFWKIAWAVYSALVLVYSGYLLSEILSDEGVFRFSEYGFQIISTALMFPFAGYYLWYSYNSYYSIKWDPVTLHLRFKKRNEIYRFKRTEIESVKLKLNDLFIKKKSGEELYFDVTDMHLSYAEINRFRKDFGNEPAS